MSFQRVEQVCKAGHGGERCSPEYILLRHTVPGGGRAKRFPASTSKANAVIRALLAVGGTVAGQGGGLDLRIGSLRKNTTSIFERV